MEWIEITSASRILVENLLGKLMFGKVSSRWVKNITVFFSARQ